MNNNDKKTKAGRPTDYKPEYNAIAYKLCLLGHTNEELAVFFEVNVDTIYEWQKVHHEFSESLKNGKELADAEVALSLYERAKGYSHDDIDIRVIENKIVKTPIRKHYPPDTTAGAIWLNNRQNKKWRKNQNEEDTPPIIISVSVDKAETVTIGNNLMEEVFGKQSA